MLSLIVSALLEVNDQLHSPSDLLQLSKSYSALTNGQETGHGYEGMEPARVEGVQSVCCF
jgi:hypothetical protein